ncbi:hypothetical protein HGR_05861 [Hylemonella gracilis ATCC 19624]|uniref:Uncharacterized protein n=1 Tax=Hylemonella gracilis ATCC 19624 TaxID=887062 RepID=F3KRU3_9BURK|nr:hypothetical protein HGR_05861 [Hylemonella gracilis ATCC 19624]
MNHLKQVWSEVDLIGGIDPTELQNYLKADKYNKLADM